MTDAERDELLIRLDERTANIKDSQEESKRQQQQLMANIKAMGQVHDAELATLRQDLNVGLSHLRGDVVGAKNLATNALSIATEARRWLLGGAGFVLVTVAAALIAQVLQT